MLLVVYDISDDRRRRHLHDKLRGLDHAIQYSAFECRDDELGAVSALCAQYVGRNDRLRIYRLCGRCYSRSISRGELLEADESRETLVCSPSGLVIAGDECHDSSEPPRRGQSDLLARVTRRENLRQAWARVKSNRGCAGIDGVGLAKFERSLDERLEVLGQQLTEGTYRASGLRHFNIPKPGGDERRLGVPTVRDRVAQEAVLLVVGPVLDATFAESSFAYRPGRSVRRAIKRLCDLRRRGWVHVVEADIVDYFGAVDHDLLMAQLAAQLKDSTIESLVRQWIRADMPKGLDGENTGIPQGAVISPLLANLYLDPFDERMEALGHRLVRYADDFVVLCRSREQAEQALLDVRAALGDLKLDVNEAKSRVTAFDEGFRFLGYLMAGELAVNVSASRLLESGRARAGR